MADENIYEELKDVLDGFKEFLEQQPRFDTIKTAIQSLASVIPKIVDVIDLLIDLMNQIKTEIQNLDVSAIPGLSDVSEFTGQITGFLDAAADLLSDQVSGTVDDIRSAINLVGGLPSLEEVKADILELIEFIVGKLGELKPA